MSREKGRREPAGETAASPLLPCWRELLEEPAALPIVPRYRALAATGATIQYAGPKSLTMRVRLELRSYRTQDDRQADTQSEHHCSFEVEGCSTGRDWQYELRKKVGRHETDLRWLMKKLIPFECGATIRLAGAVPGARSSPNASAPPQEATLPLRIGLLSPGLSEIRDIWSYGRIARAGRTMLWEIWPPGKEKRGLKAPFDAYVFALRVKLAQLFDRALAREPTDPVLVAAAEKRLPPLLIEEAACVEELARVCRNIAEIEEMIFECRTVDLWLPEDAAEPDFRRARGEIHLLETELRSLEGATDERAIRRRSSVNSSLGVVRGRLLRLETERESHRRILDSRVRTATEEMSRLVNRRTALAGKSDLLFLEREGLITLLESR